MKQTKHLAGAHEDVFSMERSGVSPFEKVSAFLSVSHPWNVNASHAAFPVVSCSPNYTS